MNSDAQTELIAGSFFHVTHSLFTLPGKEKPLRKNSRNPNTVLVTGGAGFIGSNYLLQAVRNHPDVLYVNLDALTYAGNLENLRSIEDSENYRFELGDITDRETIERVFSTYEIDAVVHFAAESHVDRSIADATAFVRTNVDGTLVLLQEARNAWTSHAENRLFHHVSTDEVFGSLGKTGVFDLNTPYAPRSPYAASKAAADHLVRSFGETYGLPFVITNTTNNYGPYQFPEKLIPLVINNARSSMPIPIYGRGENIRDWLHVSDHCEALDLVLFEGQQGSTYLIGGSQETSNIHIVEALLDVFDELSGVRIGKSRSLMRFVKDRPGHDFRYAIDSSLIETELDWHPVHDLKTGLRQTVKWYLDNEAWLENVLNDSYQEYYRAHYGNH